MLLRFTTVGKGSGKPVDTSGNSSAHLSFPSSMWNVYHHGGSVYYYDSPSDG